jgi:hypothetical protein
MRGQSMGGRIYSTERAPARCVSHASDFSLGRQACSYRREYPNLQSALAQLGLDINTKNNLLQV